MRAGSRPLGAAGALSGATLKSSLFSRIKSSQSSFPVGLETRKVCDVELPTTACMSAKRTGFAASPRSLSSYQNSPASSLRKATEPNASPAVRGE
eukprot:scaffold69933_cov25-Tisochrysis_lutea.AAC.10